MSDSLRVLIVAGKPDEAVLILHVLRQGGFDPAGERVRTAEDLRRVLKTGPWDAVVAEDARPGFNLLEILALAREGLGDIPFIVVSSAAGEARLHELFRSGVHELLRWDEIEKLPDVVRREIRAVRARRTRPEAGGGFLEAEDSFRAVFEGLPDGLTLADLAGTLVEANRAVERLTGFRREELIGRGFRELRILSPKDALREAKLLGLNALGESTGPEPFVLRRKDGAPAAVEMSAYPVNVRGRKLVLGFVREVREGQKGETAERTGERDATESVERLRRSMRGFIQIISQMIEWRDPFSAGHQKRVAQLARAVAAEMGYSPETVEGLRITGQIHDVGKIAIPAEILSRPGRLSDLEYDLVKTHAQVGFDILKGIEFPWPVAEAVFQHHERLDGSGYPRGLKGEAIIPEARVLVVADVVEAMSAHRPYRPARGLEAALGEIAQNRGRLYDPEVVDACLRLFREKGFRFED